jgi:hypothetical protein
MSSWQMQYDTHVPKRREVDWDVRCHCQAISRRTVKIRLDQIVAVNRLSPRSDSEQALSTSLTSKGNVRHRVALQQCSLRQSG